MAILTLETSAGLAILFIRLLTSKGGRRCGLFVVGGAGVVTGNRDPSCNK